MKKMALVSLAFLVALLLSYSAEAKPVVDRVNEGTYCTDGIVGECDGYFATKFWKEKFFGGGPGAQGNVLMAIGQGFTLQNVVLQGVEPCTAESCAFTDPTDPCFSDSEGNPITYNYKTTYTGGFLRLNKGPLKLWVNKGKLKDTDLVATNYSAHNPVDGSLEHFCLVINGVFDNVPDYTPYSVIATFDAGEDNYQFKFDEEGNPVFHRGYDFDAIITIGDIAQ
jgi:hypothetical protein